MAMWVIPGYPLYPPGWSSSQARGATGGGLPSLDVFQGTGSGFVAMDDGKFFDICHVEDLMETYGIGWWFSWNMTFICPYIGNHHPN